MFKKIMGLGATVVLVGCGCGGSSSNTDTASQQCTATQYLEANICKKKARQSINGFSLSAMTLGEKATLAATASSGLAVVYSSKTPTICSVSGSQVTAIKVGECSIAANQAGDNKTLVATEVVVKSSVLPAVIAIKLTQTGITTCGNETTDGLLCTKEALDELYGLSQDGEVQAGQKMSYTLLTQNGADCVKDNVTGLLWEQKTDDGGLRDTDWVYTWYNTDGTTNGGKAGYQDYQDYQDYGYYGDYRDFESKFRENTCGNSLTKCNTQAYIAALNAANYCGYSDWRMPSEEELISIMDFSRLNPSISPFFNHTQGNRYWSASSLNFDVWFVSFSSGFSNYTEKYINLYVRAVRASQ